MSGVSVLRFLLACGKIKRTVRAGWTRHGVNEPENVADHMYRMALLSALLPSTEDFKPDKVMKMAIIHDLAECVVGDITPFCGISVEEKHAREEAALISLCKELPSELGNELVSLWKEYEERKTPEAVVCKDLDKFEMILQAYEYELEAQKPGWLEEFFTATEGVFTYPCVREWVAALLQLRNASLGEGGRKE
ncbi:HD domain-containing protein 2 [Echinococcus granulosus]|uniref:5'-deoxynucleotidase HDDC2 n=1 Tax=Echinococcus granulosus TaxID=6210 RepID=A0A068WS16_ECHGR|nr:HD domain-containing protein 2 [Echinococcus granulosus]CDS22920.1 Metal dependent phosphohydrolase HD region [Echinococcus granulosus]